MRGKTSKGVFKVDGYVDTGVNSRVKKYLIEYNGCRYRTRGDCQTPTITDTTERDTRKLKALEEIGEVILMKDCVWNCLKKRLRLHGSTTG